MRKDAIGFFWEDLPPAAKQKKEKVKRLPVEKVWERPDYLPGLDAAIRFAANDPRMTDGELIEMYLAQETFIYDIEIYKNYFLVAFKGVKFGKVYYFEMFAGDSIDTDKYKWMMTNFRTVGFNSRNFDNTLTYIACAGLGCDKLKEAADRIIVEEWAPWDVLTSMGVKKFWHDHIDIQEVAPGFGSLKQYGGRMHMRKLQDLPFPPHWALSQEQAAIVRFYCINDLDTTLQLFLSLDEQIALREQMSLEYNIDLRSRSDAQIAEDVIKHEMKKILGYQPQRAIVEVGRRFRFNAPTFLNFQTPLMKSVFSIVRDAVFQIGDDGYVKQPHTMDTLNFTINGTTYNMGIGGLHSCEKIMQQIVQDDEEMVDADVTSYYPICILNQQLYPEHLGIRFLDVFRHIVDTRIAAKRAGDKKKANSLKIVINGSYGKFGNPYSILYAPHLIIQTTLTGQLSLLMLIETLELNGIHVVSANTDGIVIKYRKTQKPLFTSIIKWWEGQTKFEMEVSPYMRLNAANVNNYIAIYAPDEDGKIKVKRKGWFGETGLAKNAMGEIIMDAVVQTLIDGTPVSKTIYECKDIRKFMCIKAVSGGAAQGTVPLGKVVRWYYSNEPQEEIQIIKSGNRVGSSGGGKPMMELVDQLPSDIDYDTYIAKAEKLLEKLGYS